MMAWFPCYVNDLLGSLRWRCMTPAQRGAYWQLICWQMQAEDGHLPADVRELSILADLDLTGENAKVAEAFPLDDTGKRANPRALREWAKRQAVSATRSEIGSKGIAKRWQTDSNCYSKPIATAATTTTTTTDHISQPQPPRQRRATKVALLYRWDDLAAIYPPDKLLPDKRAKGWWKRHVKDGDDLLVCDILAGAQAWAASRQYREGFGFGIYRFLDEGIWKRLPPDDRHPGSKDEQLAAANRRTTEFFARQQGIEVEDIFGGRNNG